MITAFLQGDKGVKVVRAPTWEGARRAFQQPKWKDNYTPVFPLEAGPKARSIARFVVTPSELITYKLPFKRGFRLIVPHDLRNPSAKFFLVFPDGRKVASEARYAGGLITPYLKKSYVLVSRGAAGERFEATTTSAFKHTGRVEEYQPWLKQVAQGDHPFLELASNSTVYGYRKLLRRVEMTMFGVIVKV